MRLYQAILQMQEHGLDLGEREDALAYIGGRMQFDIPEDVVEEAIQHEVTDRVS